ncbi:MAG: hypothetical protein IJZ56_03710 [Oscillospiraceae bacterium]|nr:hypothetical protein [Oscillospiraceae bacterium]
MFQYRRIVALLLLVAVLLSAIPVSVRAQAPDTATDTESRYIVIEPLAAEDYEYYGLGILENTQRTALLYAYDQLVKGVENAESSISVYNGFSPITVDELKLVMDLYRRDYAHHFWLDNTYGISYTSETVLTITPQYLMTGDALDEAKAEFEAAADKVLAGINETMTEYEKELYIHDTLAEMIIYQESANAHNAYGALVEGIAVCEGYAEAFQYLLHRAGIWSFQVIGFSKSVGHAWNMVRIDGAFYHVDLTWDDQGEDLYHAYFNLTDEAIRADHTIQETTYTLPACTAKDEFYFTGKDTYLDSYTAAEVGGLLIENDLKVHVYIPDSVSDFVSWYGENIREIAEAAGISEGFSYSTAYLGHELILKINGMTATVSTDSGKKAYSTLTKALQNGADGARLWLLADTTESVTFSNAVTLDLNGFDITGNVTALAEVIILDSQTDDYTVANGNGYGKITGTVTGITPMEGYVTVTESDGTSFHKVDIAMKSLTLKAGSVGMYYTGSFLYDEVVARNATCGTVLSTENANPLADGSDASCLYTTTANSVLLKNIMSTENDVSANRINARKIVYGRAYLQLSDGTFLYSDVTAANLQTMVETVDTKAWGALSEIQKNTLVEMYQTYSQEMLSWNVPNLKNAG